jgi:hypothetical protein
VIFLFYGTDTEKVRSKAFEWVAKAREKEPNLAYARLTREEISPSSLEEAALSGGLFVKRLLVLLDDPFPARKVVSEEEDGEEDAVSGSVVEEKLDQLIASENAIVILAPKLSAVKAKKLALKAAKSYLFDAPVVREAARGFNSRLVDALGAKNAQALWLEVTRALRAGDAPEMLHGLLHWKARDLMEKGGRAWSPNEARRLSMNLIALLQESRRKGIALETSLERFALTLS